MENPTEQSSISCNTVNQEGSFTSNNIVYYPMGTFPIISQSFIQHTSPSYLSISVNRENMFNSLLRKLHAPESFKKQDIVLVYQLYLEYHRVPQINLTIIAILMFNYAYACKGKLIACGKYLPSFVECYFLGSDIDTQKMDFVNNFAIFLSKNKIDFNILRTKYNVIVLKNQEYIRQLISPAGIYNGK